MHAPSERADLDARVAIPTNHDLFCLSHLRWNFVFQRPQHLMTRFARDRRVFFLEEPIFDGGKHDWTEGRRITPSLTQLVPHLAGDRPEGDMTQRLREMVDEIIAAFAIHPVVLWYWTPMALPFTRHLAAEAVVFDCMDELSAFAGAPPEMLALEAELLDRADIVFTGGQSLYEAKASRHHNIHAFPSSVDVPHFAQARTIDTDPDDQAPIPQPRLGYFGVIDERMDLDLLAAVAALRRDWHLVMLGPTAKIDPARLPALPNIHYLGMKSYADLPRYLAGWDVALLPFARNESTRFISPTKTPEYLAAGRPVVSTSIRDVVRPYEALGLARIADTPQAFVDACVAALREDSADRLRRVDDFLTGVSWDATCARMDVLLRECLNDGAAAAAPRSADTVPSAAASAFPSSPSNALPI